MFLIVRKSHIDGTAAIPGSKSHTIRALMLASLAEGHSVIRNALDSSDTRSAFDVCRAFGAKIQIDGLTINVDGFDGKPKTPENVIFTGNSGTSTIFAMSMACLAPGATVLTGDAQIRRRPVGGLEEALNHLGASVFCTRGNGAPPVVIRPGKAMGGRTSLDSPTSQYLSSLLLSAPFFERDTEIDLIRLAEVPYIEMTCAWLDRCGIQYENQDFKKFLIPGRQHAKAFDVAVAADFSSATFFAVLAAVSGGAVFMKNLDMNDTQGDKAIFSVLASMGAEVKSVPGGVRVFGHGLRGREIDLNATPDAICAMAVAGCFAEGETRLTNVATARLKETDRISVMAEELRKMGADISELPDGLVIRHSVLHGAEVNGHDDHRVVMALAVAGLVADGVTKISSAEAVDVTFPDFVPLARSCGGHLELSDDGKRV